MLKKIEEKDCLRAIIYMWKKLLGLVTYATMFYVGINGFLYLIINNKFGIVFSLLIVTFALNVVCFFIGQIMDKRHEHMPPFRIKRVHRLLSMRKKRKPKWR